MLKNLSPVQNMNGAETLISSAGFPEPFKSGLEYNAPARGPWNIVHTGMLIPESHQIFACARGCLRGVVLTAAEMNAMGRLSWISLEEKDLYSGKMESALEDGCVHIIENLPEKPRVILLFISCIQLFAGFDFQHVLEQLRTRFPEIDFVDCYMHPTMRKSGLTPDQLMRRQLYASLKPSPENRKSVLITGNDRATDPDSFLVENLKKNGFRVLDITSCKTYEEYQELGECFLMISTYPPAAAGAEYLARRLNRKFFYFPLSYSYEENRIYRKKLTDLFGTEDPGVESEIAAAEQALKEAKKIIGETEIEIDYTATPRPLGLARLLLEHGFNVTRVYADVFIKEEKADFEFLKQYAPGLILTATVHVKMRFSGNDSKNGKKILAIGQKAAYFSGTTRFVNIVAGGGAHGINGICRMAEWMIEAFRNEKNTQQVIGLKGLGCESCIL